MEQKTMSTDNIELDLKKIEELGKLQLFKNLPCSFLHENNCSIYCDRPQDCRGFPFLHKKEFITRLWGVIENYSICPIVFNVFKRLKAELKFK